MKVRSVYPINLCVTRIDLSYDNNVVQNVSYYGGCFVLQEKLNNTLYGKTVEEAIQAIESISGISSDGHLDITG